MTQPAVEKRTTSVRVKLILFFMLKQVQSWFEWSRKDKQVKKALIWGTWLSEMKCLTKKTATQGVY